MKLLILILLAFLVQSSPARILIVSDYPSIYSACQNALPGDSIIISSGIYTIEGNNRIMVTDRPGPILITGETGDPRDVIIQGLGMDTDVIEMIFNLDNCPQWTFQNFTARNAYYHAFKFDHGSSNCTIRNVMMLDNGESGVKGTSDNVLKLYPDSLHVEHCKIGYTKPAGSDHPEVEGIDGVAENDWVIRNNLFVNIQKSAFDGAAYSVFTKGNSSRTIIEGNRFEDCFIGASLGGGGTDSIFFRDNDQTYEHRDGIISNNVFIRTSDAAVYINKGINCKIYNNTLIQCVLQIQLRFPQSSGYVKNNLVLLSSLNPPEPITRLRDGATLHADTANMIAGGQEFQDIIGPSYSIDAHLKSDAPEIDAGVVLSEVPDDYDGTPRPQGIANDIGAFEYIFPSLAKGNNSDGVIIEAMYSSVGAYLLIDLPHESNIDLKLYDALGRVKERIAGGIFEAGSNSVPIPISLAHGIYFAVLRSGGKEMITKIIQIQH